MDGIGKKVDLVLEKMEKLINQQATRSRSRPSSPSPSRDMQCFQCNQRGHMRRDCPRQSSPARTPGNAACFLCDQVGHFQRDCPKAATSPRWRLEKRTVAFADESEKRQRVEDTGLTSTHRNGNGMQPPTPRKRGGSMILPSSSDGREDDPGGLPGNV